MRWTGGEVLVHYLAPLLNARQRKWTTARTFHRCVPSGRESGQTQPMISLPTVPNEQLLALVVGVLVGAMLVKLNHYMAEYRRGRRLETAYADLIALATILEAMHLELERLDYDRERVVSEVKEKLDEDDDVRAAFESSEFVKHLAGKYGDEQNSTR